MEKDKKDKEKLIIFDYDGVLADTLDDLITFAQFTCNKLGVDHKVTPRDLDSLQVMSFPNYGRACGVPEHLIDEFVQINLDLFKGKGKAANIFKEIGEVVEYLSNKHILVIVTTNSVEIVKTFLSSHHLTSFFSHIYGMETSGSKAQKILMAKEKFNCENVYMIGDSLSDILSAKEAKVKSIAVTWGHQSLKTLSKGDPDYVIDHPKALFDVILK